MLGVAYLFENKPDDARREFRKLLELRPDYRFDPLLDPQRVVDFFDGVLKEEEATSREMRARRRRERRSAARDASAPPRAAPAADRRPLRTAFVRVNFVPFGAGQFQNGERAQGLAVLRRGGGAGRGVGRRRSPTNLALYGLAPHEVPRPEPPDRRRSARRIDRPSRRRTRSSMLTGIQVVSGAAVLRRRDLGRHRRHPSLPTRGAARPQWPAGRARALAAAAVSRLSPTTASAPPGVLKGIGTDGDTEIRRSPARARRSSHLQEDHVAGPQREADVTLPDPLLADSYAHIHFDGRSSTSRRPRATPRSSSTASKRKNRHKLQHDDRIRIGASS